MALPKLDLVELQTLDNWFSNIVDAVNYDLAKIEDEVPTLEMVLTTLDAAPIQYLKDSLDVLVESINDAFEQIEDRLAKLEQGGK